MANHRMSANSASTENKMLEYRESILIAWAWSDIPILYSCLDLPVNRSERDVPYETLALPLHSNTSSKKSPSG